MRLAASARCSSVTLLAAVQGDVEAHEPAALARDDEDVAVRGGDRALDAHVGEVGDGEHVHHAPRLVGRVAGELAPDRRADRAARPVAADDVLRPHGLTFELDRDAVLVDLEPGRSRSVDGLEAARRHDLEQEPQHPRLVDDHVRELRQALLGVLDPAGAHDPRRVVRVGVPEGHLVDPVGRFEQPPGEPEGLEHLDGAAGDAVGLADLERPVATIDHRGLDLRELGELRGEHQSGGPAPHDQDVDVVHDPESSATQLSVSVASICSRLIPQAGAGQCIAV